MVVKDQSRVLRAGQDPIGDLLVIRMNELAGGDESL
jgi:hypothetical protein